MACSCGHEHSFDILGISIGENAIEKLTDYITDGGYKCAFIVYDLNTKVFAECVEAKLELPYTRMVLQHAEPIADERLLGEILTAYDPDCDLIIGVGAGTINDLCRFVSYKVGVDYFIVATAASMDGYTSNSAPLITYGMKVTYPAHTPRAIIGATEIIKTAPQIMTAAGIGDILGKHISLCDWRIANIVTGEYYCEYIADMVRESIREVEESGGDIEKIMHALVKSGIAMKYAANSRPAAGSEHQLSHFWEMKFLQEGRTPVLHGIKVGVGTVLSLRMYERLLCETPDFDAAIAKAWNYSQEDWEREMRRIYKSSAENIIALEHETGKNTPQNVIDRINIYKEKWPEIIKAALVLPHSTEVAKFLKSVGAAVTPEEIGVDSELLRDAVNAAKERRDRFGVLQIMFDLGLTL